MTATRGVPLVKVNRQLPWEDIPDTLQYSKVVKSGSTTLTLSLECADHLKVRIAYSLPKVATSRILQLDSYFKTEIPAVTKATDKELATVQSHVLDALAPLSAILKTKEDVPEKIINAATDAVKLMRNASV